MNPAQHTVIRPNMRDLKEYKIVVLNLIKYFGEKMVLKNVSFSAKPGEIFIINGPSGSGKSTLLRCLNRLIEPDGGKIFLDGVDIFTMDPLELRKKMGFVSQIPAMFEGTVRDNLLYGPRIHNISVTEEYLKRILELVGLNEAFLDRRASDLSVGEQQRVALARALMLEPKILLMDEPTAHLDPENTKIIEKLIIELREKLKMTFVIVSHDVEQSKRLGDRIAFLEDGEIRSITENR